MDINLYNKRIEQKQMELTSMLHRGVSSVILRFQAESDFETPRLTVSNNDKQINIIALIVGGVSTVAGMLVDGNSNGGSIIKWMLLGGGIATIAYALYKRNTMPLISSETSPSYDFVELSSNVNRDLSKINRDIVDAWDKFISEQKDELKNSILQLDVDVDKKDKMMNAATTSSVLEYPMSSLFPKLINAANKKDINLIRTVIQQFEADFKEAIQKLCQEQIKYWSNI